MGFAQIPTPGGGSGDNTAAYLLVSGSDPLGLLTSARTIVAGPGMALVDTGTTLELISTSSQGPQGSVGPAGPTGSQGPTGSTGPQGVAGSPFLNLIQIGTNTAISLINVIGLVTTSVGTLSCSLPNVGKVAGINSGSVILKDISGQANGNPFTVFPTGGSTIDGVSASYAYYTNFGALKLFTDGANWFTY